MRECQGNQFATDGKAVLVVIEHAALTTTMWLMIFSTNVIDLNVGSLATRIRAIAFMFSLDPLPAPRRRHRRNRRRRRLCGRQPRSRMMLSWRPSEQSWPNVQKMLNADWPRSSW
jgi:hypothetical protein